MKAIILAGGMGTRLHPLTVNQPKPMVPLANQPMMEYIVELLAKHGFTEVIALLYHQPEMISNYFGDGNKFGVKLTYVQADKDLGTAGAVKFACKDVNEPLLVISADLVTDLNLSAMAKYHKEKRSAVTIALTRKANPLSYGIVIIDKDNKIKKFMEKPSWGEVFSDTINSGIYILDPKAIKAIPDNIAFDFSLDLFPNLLKNQADLFGFVDSGYWRDIGQIEDYSQAHTDVLLNLVKIKLKEKFGVNTIVSNSANLDGLSMIGDGSFIGDESRLINSVIGNNCKIGRNTIIKDSVVWDGAQVGNGARLDGNIVGKQAKLGDRTCLEPGAVVGDNCQVGNDALIKAQVKLWPDKTIDEGAIVTRSMIMRNHWTSSIFGSYGVTGICNIEITPQFAADLGAAYGSVLGPHSMICSSRDSHKSSRMIYRALISGVLSTGVNVSNLEMVPIPVSRYAVPSLCTRGGFHVRKSPFDNEVIDIKFFDENGMDLSSVIEKKIERIYFSEDHARSKIEDVGELSYPLHRVAEKYEEGLMACLDEGLIKNAALKLVIDYSFGAASQIFPSILGNLGLETVALDAHIDEHKITKDRAEFEKSLNQMTKIVKSINANMGVLVDTGAEKAFICDENGYVLPGSKALAMMALLAFKSKPNSAIAVPVKESSYIEKLAKKYKGTVLRTSNNFRSMMEPAQKKQVSFVGESLGGFIFPEFMPCFDAMMTVCKLTEFLAKEKVKLSEVVAEIPEIHLMHREMACSIGQKAGIMRRSSELVPDADKIEMIDGLKFWHGESWALILPDSMRPVLHIYVESQTQEKTQLLLDRYMNIINKIKQGGI